MTSRSSTGKLQEHLHLTFHAEESQEAQLAVAKAKYRCQTLAWLRSRRNLLLSAVLDCSLLDKMCAKYW